MAVARRLLTLKLKGQGYVGLRGVALHNLDLLTSGSINAEQLPCTFHTKCIGLWLRGNIKCPNSVCRLYSAAVLIRPMSMTI